MTARILPNLAGRDNSHSKGSKKHATNVQQDLQFVYLPNDLKLDITARKRVRSHVARDFRRRAKVPGSSSLDLDDNAANSATKERALGQKHRFRFGLQGLQETGKQAARKSSSRKASSLLRESLPPGSSVVRRPSVTEDPGGTIASESPDVQTTVATDKFIQRLSVDASYSSDPIWDESYRTSNLSNTGSQCCITAQTPVDRLRNNQLVCRAKTWHTQQPVEKLQLSTTLTGNLDPFNSIPIIDTSRRTQELMHHFHLRIMASPLMMNPRKEWFSLAIQDHALFHVALSHAAGNLGLLMQKGDSVESLLHRMEAIRIINERLSDLSNGISDGTIGAVASMASYEATNGTLDSIRTHMNGLEHMVKLRGGLQAGGFSAHLRRLIAWADLNSANALSSPPHFPPLSDRQHLQSDQFAIDPIAFQLYSTPLSTSPMNTHYTQSTPTTLEDSSSPYISVASAYNDIRVLAPKVAYCFITLRQLSRLLNISGPKTVIRMDHTWYSDMAYMLQRRLMHLSDTYSSQSSRIERPCCIAALIYLECCVREIHPRSRIVETLVKDLKVALLRLKGLASAGMSNLIFWALAVGVGASGSQAEREWFVAQLGALCRVLGGRGWEGARGILQGILWPERECELTRALVWSEVETADTSIDCRTVGSD